MLALLATALLTGRQSANASSSFLLLAGGADSWIVRNAQPTKFESHIDLQLNQIKGKLLITAPDLKAWKPASGKFEDFSEAEGRRLLGNAFDVVCNSHGVPNRDATEVAHFLKSPDDITAVEILNGETLKRQRIIKLPRADDGSLAWSADGKRLAISILQISRLPTADYPPNDLYIYDLQTAKLRRLGFGYEPQWSPDGSLYALEGSFDGGKKIVRFKAPQTSTRKQVVVNGRFYEAFAVSPEGKEIATMGWRTGDTATYLHLQTWTSDGKFERTVCSERAFQQATLAGPKSLFWLP